MAKSPRKAGDDATSEPLVDEPVFLGTLRSEFDTDDEIDERWEALVSVATGVLGVFARGELSEEETARALAQLRMMDSDGVEWTVGATTGHWYRRSGTTEAWVRAVNPTAATPMLGAEPAWLRGGAAVLVEQAHAGRVQADEAPAAEDAGIEAVELEAVEVATRAEDSALAPEGDPGAGSGLDLLKEETPAAGVPGTYADPQEEALSAEQDKRIDDETDPEASYWDALNDVGISEVEPDLAAAPALAPAAPRDLPELPASYLPDETAGWVIDEPLGSPAPRTNAVAASDVLGWQPAKRTDGPELPAASGATSGWTTSSASEPDGEVPTTPSVGAVDEDSADESAEALFLPDELLGAKAEEEEDDFFLPDDLFYNPDADK